ncbi:MAG: hypothetical protein JNK74_28765, partial [Candidatus Hydrogenedentes bacterium]|nr:hypothetical protein [Candidatus Hydrogenedentota bacterium]
MPLRTFCIALCIAIVSGAGAAPVVPGFERAGDAASTVSPGLLLYNELQCAACHGVLAPRQSAFPPRNAPKLQNIAERVRIGY